MKNNGPWYTSTRTISGLDVFGIRRRNTSEFMSEFMSRALRPATHRIEDQDASGVGFARRPDPPASPAGLAVADNVPEAIFMPHPGACSQNSEVAAGEMTELVAIP